MPIRGLLFDANGVLYRRTRNYDRIEEFLAPYGLHALPREEVKRRMRAEHLAAQTGRMTIEEYFAAKIRAHGLEDPDGVAAGVRLLMENAADIELYPNAVEALGRLRAVGVRLAIVTDSVHPAERKLGWLEAAGLPHETFDAAVSSVEVGFAKPDPRIYRAALERIGVGVAEAGFVGHATDELEGAADVGLAAIAFRPDDPEVRADVRIDDLLSLVDLAGC